jgi:hypothetical protein
MWVLLRAFRRYTPYIVFPVAVVVGFVGYNLEGFIRGDKTTPWNTKTIQEERDERTLDTMKGENDSTVVPSLKSKTDIPKTVLGRNELKS